MNKQIELLNKLYYEVEIKEPEKIPDKSISLDPNCTVRPCLKCFNPFVENRILFNLYCPACREDLRAENKLYYGRDLK